jgi:SPOR domain
MVLRLLFVLLIALNIAVGAWLLLGQDDTHVRSATDPDVPALHLLSERPAPPASAPVAATTMPAPASVPTPAPAVPASATNTRSNSNSHVYTCIAIGPFATPLDLRNARSALTAQAARMRSRQEQATQSHGWWVYLPASASRDQALAQARRLSAANIKDYFVVGSGDQPNTVSLGLFKDPANARKRRDEVVAAGFPAQMSERTETVPEYWLDLAVADNPHFDWRSRVRNNTVGSHSTGCF